MNGYTQTTRNDYDGDGTWDAARTETFEFAGDKLALWTQTLENINGVSQYRQHYAYDEHGFRVGEVHESADVNTGGEWMHAGTVDRAFDVATGQMQYEVLMSPDFDGDGIIGDYQNWTTCLYDAGGRQTAKLQDFFAYGVQDPSSYLDETWTYNANGTVASYKIDDPGMYDCDIVRTYNYKHGNLQNIKEQNEIRFGDERPRIDESWTYNKDGSMKTHTSWADYSDKGWFQRVDTAYTWKDGYDSQRVTYDATGDFIPEAVKFVENWYNAGGHLTHTLISHDDEGNGGPLAGGFDRRDLIVKTWDGDVMMAETTDYGADGIIEQEFTHELLLA